MRGQQNPVRRFRNKQGGYIGIGARRVINGGQTWAQRIRALLDGSDVYAPLTHSAVPTRGSLTPSFTRATTETGQKWDDNGYLDFTALAGEMIFKGARRERNWIQAPTENWSSAGWVKSGISVSGNRLTATGANGVIYDNVALGMGTGRTAIGSVTLSRVTGTGNIDVSTNGGTTWTTVSVTGARVSVSLTGNINGQFAIRIVTSGDAVDAIYPQLEDVTGQTTQTASEYVSVGALIHDSQDPNYLSLSGGASDYASTPDSSANSITGDIDVRVKVAMADWTPSAYSTLVSKWTAGGLSYLFAFNNISDGKMIFQTSADSGVVCSVGTGFADGTTHWVRVTRVAATGKVNFYTSEDGSTWTQLGTEQTVTAGAITDAGNSEVTIGGGTVSAEAVGKFFQAQVYNGIAGTLAVDFNPNRDATTPTGTITSSTTSEVWTINGASSVVRNAAYHGSMVDGVKCFDTDRLGNPISTSATYDAVTLNGVAGTYVSTPDSVAASVTGDIDIRVKVALADYTPAVENIFVCKNDAANNMAYYWILNGAGTMSFITSPDGTAGVSATSTAATGITDGATYWLRVTRDVDNGAGGNTTAFYKSSDGVTWTQIGSDVVNVGTTSIYDSAAPLALGMDDRFNAYPLNGKIYRSQIYNGINGTLAVDFNASRYAGGGSTLTGSTGETWTLNGSAVIHPTNYPIVGYVPWEAQTNVALQSNAFGTSGAPTAPWTENGGVLGCVQNVVGPDGTTSAWTFTDDNVAGIEGRAQSITLTAAAWTASLFVKKTTGATTYPVLSAFTGAVFAGATIDTNNGVCTPWVSFDALTAAAGMSARCVSHDANYWRASLTFTGTAAAWTFIKSPAVATTPTQSAFVGATAAAVTGSAVFYGAQVELGSFATPYVPTTTVAVARNASVLTYTGAISASEGTVYAELSTAFAVASGYKDAISSAAGTGASILGISTAAASTTRFSSDSTTLTVKTGLSDMNTGARKTAVSWGGSTSLLTGDGVTPTSSAFDGTMNVTASFGIGCNALGTGNWSGNIRNVRIWNRKLSASELQAITA